MKENVLLLEPGRSVALPRKTRGRHTLSTFLILHPEVELVDPTRCALEARSFSSLAVQNEAALGVIHHPVASIAGGTHGSKWATHLGYLVHHCGVLALIGLNIQDLLAQIGHPASAG